MVGFCVKGLSGLLGEFIKDGPGSSLGSLAFSLPKPFGACLCGIAAFPFILVLPSLWLAGK